MQIRRATAADIRAIIEIELQSATAAHWSEQQYREAISPAQGAAQRLVLISQGADQGPPTGFLVAHHVALEWELENVAVAPHERRRGLAKQLLNTLFAEARTTNSESIFLEVRESNLAARTFYERAGFQKTGRRHAYYADPPEDAILYRLALK
jgi:ribosomal-protein-alanine N-acetyltransferase